MAETARRAFRFDDPTMAKLDHDRGEVNRSEWVRRLIMEHKTDGPPPPAVPAVFQRSTQLVPKARVMPPRVPSGALARPDVTPRFK